MNPISPTGCFGTTVLPPSRSIAASASSMLGTSMTTTGPGAAASSRASMPPLMKPGSLGPVSLLGPLTTSVYSIPGISDSCQSKASR